MKRSSMLLVCALLLATPWEVSALVRYIDTGMWPAEWPMELEPLRARAKTLDVGAGTQEHIYTIPFDNRDEFERYWPILIGLRTPASPLTISKVGVDSEWGDSLSNEKPCVRIKGPSCGVGTTLKEVTIEEFKNSDRLITEGKAAKADAPWPKELIGSEGQLPEYVTMKTVDGRVEWTTIDDVPQKMRGFHFRARVDVELVIDGEVIDLNRIALPKDAQIIDRRFP